MLPKGTILFNTFLKNCITERDKYFVIFKMITHKTSTSTTTLNTLKNFNNRKMHLSEELPIFTCFRYDCLLHNSNSGMGISEDLAKKTDGALKLGNSG